MRNLSNEFKVGGVIILAVVILLFGVIWVKDYRYNVEYKKVEVLFPQIGNLDVGDPVAVLGVDKGEVKDIRLNGGNVKVTLTLESDVELKEDVRISVMNMGLMGERFVAIWPGESPKLCNLSQPIRGGYSAGIPEAMAMMGEMITQVKSLLTQFEDSFIAEGNADKLRMLVEDLHQLSSSAREFFDTEAPQMAGAIDDLSQMSSGAKTFLDSNSVEMQTAVTNFADASQDLKELTEKLNVLTGQISRGEGTIGKTFADDSLYNDLRRTVNNLDSLVTDFKQHPKKYVKVSVF